MNPFPSKTLIVRVFKNTPLQRVIYEVPNFLKCLTGVAMNCSMMRPAFLFCMLKNSIT